MAETIRYARIGQEDLNLGSGTFEVRLADGRVVVLTKVDIGAILSDADLSSRAVTLDSLTVTTLTATTINPTTINPGTTLRLPEKADPASPSSGEVWMNSGGTFPEYADDASTPAVHAFLGNDTTQSVSNKTYVAPIFSGTATGTYVLAGTPSLGSPLDVSDEDLTSIDEAHFTDAAANPTAAGRVRRSGNELLWRQALGTTRLLYADVGTVMLFYQSAAPTGWTQVTSQNNKALRVVSGSGGVAGGASTFSTIFNSGTSFLTNSHTLTESQIPSHTHPQDATTFLNAGANNLGTPSPGTTGTGGTTGATGGGGGHTHTLTMDLAFIDIILCSKD